MRTHRPSAFSRVCSARGAENGAVHRVRDLAANRVADVVPHNPKVTEPTTRCDVHVPSAPFFSRRVSFCTGSTTRTMCATPLSR